MSPSVMKNDGRRVIEIDEPAEKPLSRHELTEFLGIGMSTLQRELTDKRFPRFYIGKREFFSARDVIRYLKEKTERKTSDGEKRSRQR
jgi:predicted DNA-binding transcriptional regulator AlpA